MSQICSFLTELTASTIEATVTRVSTKTIYEAATNYSEINYDCRGVESEFYTNLCNEWNCYNNAKDKTTITSFTRDTASFHHFFFLKLQTVHPGKDLGYILVLFLINLNKSF